MAPAEDTLVCTGQGRGCLHAAMRLDAVEAVLVAPAPAPQHGLGPAAQLHPTVRTCRTNHRSLQHTSETTAPARSEVAALPIMGNCNPTCKIYCTVHQGLVQPTSEVTAPHARGYCSCQITLICPHRGSLRACCCTITSHLTVAVVYMQPQYLRPKSTAAGLQADDQRNVAVT